MIQARITKHKNHIQEIVVKGHANSAPYGQDLVCAEVSAILFGLCNAIDEAKLDCDISIQKNTITIKVIEDSSKLQHMLQVGEIQLKTVEETNQNFIKIKTLEV